jgi:hypothetical protein
LYSRTSSFFPNYDEICVHSIQSDATEKILIITCVFYK